LTSGKSELQAEILFTLRKMLAQTSAEISPHKPKILATSLAAPVQGAVPMLSSEGDNIMKSKNKRSH